MFTYLRYLWLLARGESAPEQALHFFNFSGASRNKCNRVLKRAFPGLDKKCTMTPRLFVERPDLLTVGKETFVNTEACFLNAAKVTIGERSLVGPGVKFCTTYHHVDPALRAADPSAFSEPIVVGNNVWIGAGVIVCPGVTIGDGAVVGAGSVVTRSVGRGETVVGIPAKPKMVKQNSET